MKGEMLPADSLMQALSEVAVEISAKLDAERVPWGPSDHSRFNWAREIGHPCKKHLVHCRVDWRQAQPIDIDGIWRTDEGKRIEWEVKKWLGDIGYEITKAQVKFKTDDPGMEEFADLWLSGKIDGMSPLNRELPEPFSKLREVPLEIKTVNPNYWGSTQSVEAIKRHSAFWIAMIPDQLNVYLKLSRNPGGILTLATFGKRPRILPVLFDPELWLKTEAICNEVNRHMEAGTYPPPIPFNATICGMCEYNHICQPIKPTAASEIDPLDKFKFELYLEAKDWRDRFNELHAELIGDKKKPGKYHGKEGVLEEYIVSTRRHMRKVYKIPSEEKEKHYVGDEEVIITTIERIDKQGEQ